MFNSKYVLYKIFSLFLIFISLFFFTACDFNKEKVEEIKKTDLKDFVAVDIGGKIKASISSGDSYSVIFKAVPASLDGLKINIDENKVLHIRQYRQLNYYPIIEIKIEVPTALDSIIAKDNAEIIVNDLKKNRAVSLEAFQNAKLTVKNFLLKDLIASVSTNSILNLEGQSNNCKLKASGESSLDIENLKCINMDLDDSTDKDISIKAKKLDIKLSGTGNIYLLDNCDFKVEFWEDNRNVGKIINMEGKEYKSCKLSDPENCPFYCEKKDNECVYKNVD